MSKALFYEVEISNTFSVKLSKSTYIRKLVLTTAVEDLTLN